MSANVVVNPRVERGSKKMLFLRDAFMRAFPNERPPIDPKRVADWAWERGLWKPTETDPREVLRRKLSRALRHEYITDPQNREVRASFASVEEVMTSDGPKRMARYYPIFEAPADVARQHFQLERRIAVENASQLSLDLQSYNDNNKFGAILPSIDWNISKDMEEMNLPKDYDPDRFGDRDPDE
jgi:hypothetical protein